MSEQRLNESMEANSRRSYTPVVGRKFEGLVSAQGSISAAVAHVERWASEHKLL